jgi:cell division protein FtsI/penicillin-binding protein 2
VIALLLLAATPSLQGVVEKVLAGPGDAAAVLELASGRLIFEHRPALIAEKRIIPGSVIKLFTAAALLDGRTADREVRCGGAHGGRVCWLRGGHGEVRFTRAIADSCNIWFYAQAESLPPEAFLRALRAFGIGEPIDTDVRGAIRDHVPGTIAPRDLPDLAVGDSIALETSPLSLLRAVSVIATRGRMITPSRARPLASRQTALEPAHLERIAEAMEEAVESGTLAETLRGLDVAAKTGTGKKRGERGTRGVVLGFFPRREPRFAFVVVKGEGRGAADAGPAARELLRALIEEERK